MANKDRLGKPQKKQKKQTTADELAERRAERKQRKHTLKIIRRKATRRGLFRPIKPAIN
jgi:hypothetical protein